MSKRPKRPRAKGPVSDDPPASKARAKGSAQLCKSLLHEFRGPAGLVTDPNEIAVALVALHATGAREVGAPPAQGWRRSRRISEPAPQ